jgi:hypothetical protein
VDVNHYTTDLLVQDRLRHLRETARRHHLARAARPPRPGRPGGLRTAVTRAGGWLRTALATARASA